MTVSEADKKTLAALASAKETHEELRSLINFYEAIYGAQAEAKAGLCDLIDIPPEPTRGERLKEGLLQQTFEQLHVDSMHFVRLVRQMSYIILESSPDWELPSQHFRRRALTDIARRWFESGEPVVGIGSEPPLTLVALSVRFALSCHLQKAAEILLPLIEQEEWQRNICPICGGKPGFAVLAREDGRRSLFCPRCHGLWSYKRTRCPCCHNDEGVVYYPSEDQVYRLYVCPKCKHYLKTIDLRQTGREPILPVERILTVGMDLAAQREGYEYC